MQPYFLQNQTASIAFWAAYIVWFVPELIGGITQRVEAGAYKRDRGSIIVLYTAIFVGLMLAYYSAFLFENLATPEPRTVIFWLGIALMLFGVAFRWYAVRVLGKYFTREVAVRADQSVVQVGPYRYVRHPSYTGSLLTFLGIGLTLGNWASIAAITVIVFAAYWYRVRAEERALVEAIGQPYVDYMQRTRRFIPFIV